MTPMSRRVMSVMLWLLFHELDWHVSFQSDDLSSIIIIARA